MLKKEARATFKEKRKDLTYTQKLKLDDLLLIQFQKLPLPFLSYLLSFHPIEEQNEVDTFILTEYLQFKNPGLQIAFPKTNLLEKSMQAIICEEEDVFVKNRYNIHEPVKCETIDPLLIDMVFIPLLAFDTKGNRVGYGKGFYDIFLKQCRADCIKLGLSYFEAVDAIEDAGEFDVPLDFCITPQKAYVF